MKNYSIGEVAQMLDLPVSTLRYYDKEGILKKIHRTDGGIRIFTDEDIKHLKIVECLKSTGMPLKDIKTYFEWCEIGDSTIELRYNMFLERRAEILHQMEELQRTLDMVNFKCEYYTIAKEAGTMNNEKLIRFSKDSGKKNAAVREIV